jgi:ribosomal protein L32
MAVRFGCPTCTTSLTVSERFSGLRVRCPHCGNPVDVPASLNASAPSVPPDHDGAGADSAVTALVLKRCPFCAEAILSEARLCRYCGQILDRQLAIQKEREHIERLRRQQALRVPWNAWASLICGIVGTIPFVGALLGPAAILAGVAALNEMRLNPRMRARNIAVTGIVLGVVGLAGSLLALIYLAKQIR